jgi:streptogramin lyase
VYISDGGSKTLKWWNPANPSLTTTLASFGNPRGIAVDSLGNVYVADSLNNAIDEWNVSTQQLAQLPVPGLSGPTAVAVDQQGNVYIADTGNNAIKEWSAGVVTVVWANGLNAPAGVTVDGQGNVDIADTGNNLVKQWNAATQQLTSVVSTGLSGPTGLVVDGQGNIYVADTNNSAIKKLTPAYLLLSPTSRTEGSVSGTDSISTQVLPAGTALSATSDQSWLSVTSVAGGNVNYSFLANTSVNNRVAHVTVLVPQVTITQNGDTPASVTKTAGDNQGVAPGTAFTTPLQVNVKDAAGLAVQGASVTFTTAAGSTGANGTFASSAPVTTDQNGNATASVLTANLVGGTFTASASVSGQSAVFSLTILTYTLGTSSVSVGSAAGSNSVILVGTGAWTAVSNASWLHLKTSSGTSGAVISFTYDANTTTGSRTGTLTISGLTFTVNQAGTNFIPISLFTTLVSSGLKAPQALALDAAGDIYIADSANNAIKERLASTGVVNTLVGSGLSTPYGVTVDGSGNVFISDSKDNLLKKYVPSTQVVTTITTPTLSYPFGIVVDKSGNLFFADYGHNWIREWAAATAATTTLVSTGLNGPKGVAMDALGNLYFADSTNNAIKEWNATTKVVTTLVSTGLSSPNGVAVDGDGNVYIADTGNNAIKRWSPSTLAVTTVLSTGIKSPGGVAVDPLGNLYIADTGDNFIEKLTIANLALGATSRTENPPAGSDSVTVQVLPAATPLTASSDQTWLTITGTSGGSISFSYTANTSVTSRVAHITVLGQVITVTQNGDVPASMVKTAGHGQSVAINVTYPINLQVQVKDAAGNLVQGASVTFTTTAGSKGSNGSFSSSTPVVTTVSGIATAWPLKANGVAGTFTATATVGSVSTVFSLTITAH